jgi:hypothetical protein
MSVGAMQTLGITNRHYDCQPLEPMARQVSIGGIVDRFQQALIGLDLFGPGVGAIFISGALLLISLLQQAAHCGTNKGVI